MRGRSARNSARTWALWLLVPALIGALWTATRAGSALVVAVPMRQPDAIVSLASHEWERLPTTAVLAARHPDALVLLTLPPSVTDFNCHDCANRARRLARAGVEERRIRVLPISGSGTYGEALAVRAYLLESGLRRLVIVTTPYHTRRSLATFRHVLAGTGAAIGIEPATANSPARPERWWIRPYDLAYVGYEWAAVIYYSGRYGVSPWSAGS